MHFLKQIKKFIHNFDLFYSSQLLRYQSETQYKTLTGGFVSMSIITIIVLGFMSMISQTLQRTSITSSVTTIKQLDPPLTILRPGQENMFMVGIAILQTIDVIQTIDLYNGPKYFDLQMHLLQLQYGVPTHKPLNLEQCTRQHWKGFPQFVKNFDNFLVGRWACLPLNQSYPIQGMYSSPLNTQIQIRLFKCRNSTQNNNECASTEEIDALFTKYRNFYLSFNYINSAVNPNLKEYISYYIEGNDYSIFSSDIGAQSWVYFTDYEIQSDNSIWPFSQMKTETGFLVQQKATNRPFGAYDDSPLATLYLAKSVNSLRYGREVQKISAVFSYIGGLVGAVTAALFFVNIYTDSSLQVTIGLSLFSQGEESQQGKIGKNFDFFGFLRLLVFRLLRLVGWDGSWQVPEKLESFQSEAVKQLDVQSLLKRIIKLQSCMTRLFTEEELKAMKNDQLITVENARRMRSLLLKQQKTPYDKTSKVINIDNFLDRNDKIEFQVNSNLESAGQMIRNKNAQQQLNVANTYKVNEVQSIGESSVEVKNVKEENIFVKLQGFKEKRKVKMNLNKEIII